MFNFGKEKANDIKESNRILQETLDQAKLESEAMEMSEEEKEKVKSEMIALQARFEKSKKSCVFIRLVAQKQENDKLKRELETARAEALEAKQTASALYERLVEDYSH